MENNMNNLEKNFMNEENNLHTKLNKLNDNVEKINEYNKKKYLDNIRNLDNRIRQLDNELKQNNNLSDVRRGKIEKDIKELTKYKNKYEKFLDNIDEIINFIKNDDEKQDNININIEKKYGEEFFNFLKNIVEGKNINFLEEEYADMPYLETEEAAAENIADIHEGKHNTRKKDDTRKKESNFNKHDKDKNGYNINGVDKNGINGNGLNINGIKGTKKRYPKKKF